LVATWFQICRHLSVPLARDLITMADQDDHFLSNVTTHNHWTMHDQDDHFLSNVTTHNHWTMADQDYHVLAT
jgi:hypothetical protein